MLVYLCFGRSVILRLRSIVSKYMLCESTKCKQWDLVYFNVPRSEAVGSEILVAMQCMCCTSVWRSGYDLVNWSYCYFVQRFAAAFLNQHLCYLCKKHSCQSSGMLGMGAGFSPR